MVDGPGLIINLPWLRAVLVNLLGEAVESFLHRALTLLRAQEGPRGVTQLVAQCGCAGCQGDQALGSLPLLSSCLELASLHCMGRNGKVINQSRVFLFSLGAK